MTSLKPLFAGLYFNVKDMDATVAFYRLLGLDVPDGAMHIVVPLAAGINVAFGDARLTKTYNPEWRDAIGGSPNDQPERKPSSGRGTSRRCDPYGWGAVAPRRAIASARSWR